MSPAERDVLTSLPRTRPTRRSAKRTTAPAPVAAVPDVEPVAEEPPAANADAPPSAGWAAPEERRLPRGRELVGTGIQAVGELAHLGLKVYARAVKSAFRRLPKP